MASSLHLLLAATALALLTAGCHRTRASSADSREALELAGGDAGYLAPPEVIKAEMARNGAIRVSGSAPPRAMVEITAPEGEQEHTRADRRGAWGVTLPGGRTRLYAVSALVGSRPVHAEGALVTAAGVISPGVMVRAGYAARPLMRARRTLIATIDYDPQGAIALAGDAPPGTKLTLAVDGAPAAIGQADAQGRYALMVATRRLTFGPHRLQVRGAGQLVERQVALDTPTPLTAPYQAWATAQGWRVEWALTGGGVQTTLMLSPQP